MGHSFPAILLLLLLQCLLLLVTVGATVEKKVGEEESKGYIVYMAKHEMPAVFQNHSHWYDSSLKSVSPAAHTVYTYDTLIHGYSSRLTSEEAEAIKHLPGVLAVLPEIIYQLHTTRTPDFLGLSKSQQFNTPSADLTDIVVAVFDSGVWPESESFSDHGMPPVPSSWRGECVEGDQFNASMCNRKLIGARYFNDGYKSATSQFNITGDTISPRDDDGHGTHTSSTAAGSPVKGASLFGNAEGVARGMAMSSRLAVYKVCWIAGCFSSDILAAMEAALDDGVHVMSLSLGGDSTAFYTDHISIGAFSAMEKGVLVVCSAGNSGPLPHSLSNSAPWITTVGASTLDRDFPVVVTLGNGVSLTGTSIYDPATPLPSNTSLPIFYAAYSTNRANLCLPDTLNSDQTRGKIVFCDRGSNSRTMKGALVKAAGGVGMLLGNTKENGEELTSDPHVLPTAALGANAASVVRSYILSDKKPTATIVFKGTVFGANPSPVVAGFSSRGPNSVTPVILKPDLIAPGVNILASWSGSVSPTGLSSDARRVEHNIMSGTSMSCPHVSGLAAVVKGVHPDWSPAAVRSALMTTAYTSHTDNKRILDSYTSEPATPFDMGSGHVNPVAALDPGLVYEITADGYLGFLCALGHSSLYIQVIARKNISCSDSVALQTFEVGFLNYPSFAVVFDTQNNESVVKYKRELKNVGSPGIYRVKISTQVSGLNITVVPSVLNFSRVNEVKGYSVTFTSIAIPSKATGFGNIEWSDGVHGVNSPVAVTWE